MSNRRGSGSCCSAIGCSMRRGTNLLSQVKMYKFPTDPVRRAAWCNALKRANWAPNKNSLICNAHFVTGQPSLDSQHPDYVPSIFNFNEKAAEDGEKKLKRYERSTKRQKHDLVTEDSNTDNASVQTSGSIPSVSSSSPVHLPSFSSSTGMQDVAVQTDISLHDITKMEIEIESLKKDNKNLRTKAMYTKTYDSIVNKSNKCFKFHTGLENFALFNSILSFILSIWQPKIKVSLKPCEQLLLVLMKLRLGLVNEDLACRFEIGVGTVSTVFHSWINVMSANFEKLIIWPSKNDVSKNVPQCFKDVSLENVRCIIDCTEIFIEKPRNFIARAQTYSNYKHHNTLKFLVGIAPSGVISFISKVWGGRVSDKCLTIKSGFLDKVEKDDVILADRGFRIADLLSERKAKLLIPASTKNKNQLSPEKIYQSRDMSKVRVHVERAIRKIKTYKILESNLPISMIKKKSDKKFSTIDKILCIICALCNLSNPIIKT